MEICSRGQIHCPLCIFKDKFTIVFLSPCFVFFTDNITVTDIITGSTTCGKIVAVRCSMRFPHLSTGSLVHSSFGCCSSSLRFECAFFQLLFSNLFTLHRFSMRFTFVLNAGHSVKCFLLNHSGCLMMCVLSQRSWPWSLMEIVTPWQSLISWCQAHFQGTNNQVQQSNPKPTVNLLHVTVGMVLFSYTFWYSLLFQ